ncbi:F-box only protein 9-like [Styela clava]
MSLYFDLEDLESFDHLSVDDDGTQNEFEKVESSDANQTEKERIVGINATHNANNALILKLPHEILSYILKWVISSHLDVISLGQWALVCKDFYSLSQESDLWHSMCQKIWGEKVIRKPYSSWQSLFLCKPHIHVHGVYISRNSYVRAGDGSSFRYKPYLYVEYFRILRFFHNGEVMMLTTPQDPREVVHKLEHKNKKVQGLLLGRYVLQEVQDQNSTAIITASLRPFYIPKDITRQTNRNRRGNRTAPEAINEYQLELELTSTSSKKRFNKLTWVHHSCCTSYPGVVEKRVSTYDITRQYPALYFNRIKTFTAESLYPL